MTVTQALLSFAVIAALITIIPGLDTALVLRSAISRGPRFAMTTALGIVTGCLVWGVAAAVGASALLAASEGAYRVLTLVGAAYMVWLGASLLVASFRRRGQVVTGAGAGAADVDADVDADADADAPRGGLVRAWATGVGTNLLNPKIGVFYIATIPQFIPHGVSPLLMGVLLAGVHNVLGLVWFALLVGFTRLGARWLAAPRVTRIVDRVTGTVLIGFGVKLALQPH